MRYSLPIFVFALALAGCSSTPSNWSWLDFGDKKVSKPAVLVVLQDEGMARLVSSEIAVAANESGMQAKALSPKTSTAEIIALGGSNKYDAILISRLRVIDGTALYTSPAQITQSKNNPQARFYNKASAFHALAVASFDPIKANRNQRYVVETLVFRLPSGDLISSQSRDVLEPGSALGYIKAGNSALQALH